jgi:predicted DNA-binding transcriptional regulator YafY
MSGFLEEDVPVRADRLLSILLLLQRHGKLPATDLAERLEVSTRTIYRDVEALSGAGVPVYAERGRNGGVSLVPGYRTDLTGLTSTEAQALFLFSGRGPIDALGRGDDLRQAIRKLLAGVPDEQRDEVERISGRFVVDPQSWRRRDDEVPHLSTLQDAVLGDRRLTISYPSRSLGRVRDYRIDPYGLVAKAGVWYLLAGTAEGTRTFRVSRVQAVAAGDETFVRPEGLDVESLWERSSQAFIDTRTAGCAVLARVEADAIERVLRFTARFVQSGPTGADPGDADRRPVLHLRFADADHALAMLAVVGGEIEVVAPAEVRAALGRLAEATLARHPPI